MYYYDKRNESPMGVPWISSDRYMYSVGAKEFFGFVIHNFAIILGKKTLASIFCGWFVRMTTRSGKVYCDGMLNKQTNKQAQLFKKYCPSLLLSFNSFWVLVRPQKSHFGPSNFFGF